MKTIIVATDYSKGAENALKYAVNIARFCKTNIVLFNSYQLSTHAANGLISPAGIDELVSKSKNRLKEYADKLSLQYGISFGAFSSDGLIEEELNALASDLDAAMIVMGMRGNSLEYKLFGNTTTSVVRSSGIPVMVIPEGLAFKLPEKILFACDYHQVPCDDTLNMLKDFTATFDAEVQVFHVGKTPDLATVGGCPESAVVSRLENSLIPLKHSYRDVEVNDIILGIREGIQSFKADVLVMAPHKYGFFESMFHKSKTREMVIKVSLPLLALPC